MSWTAVHVRVACDDDRWCLIRSLWRSQGQREWFVVDRIEPALSEVAWNGTRRPRALAQATVVSDDHSPCVAHPTGGSITEPDQYFELLALASTRAGDALDEGATAEQSSAALWRELVPDRGERVTALQAGAAWLERRATGSGMNTKTAGPAEAPPERPLDGRSQLVVRAAHAHYVMLTPTPLAGSEPAALWQEAQWWRRLAQQEG